jgi:hypothetical protein
MATMNVIRIELDQRIVERLRRPILKVWNQVSPDLMRDAETMGERIDNESAVECCVDADRLRYEGSDRAAADFFDMICTEHGYPKVLTFLSKHIRLV